MLVKIKQKRAGGRNVLQLEWRYQDIPFSARLNPDEVMVVWVHTLNGIEVLHVPYSKSARLAHLVRDLKLKLVSQALINQADLAGKLGVSA